MYDNILYKSQRCANWKTLKNEPKDNSVKIYFDESGQTGTHLFDPIQPYFTLGSTNIEEAEAADILNRCFPHRQGNELKSQKLLRRPQGRRGFLEFAREVGKTPDRFCTVKIGKRFAVVSKMVDFLVEPLLHARGYDFYASDYAVRFANSACFVFEHLLEGSDAENLMRLYNEFARKPSVATLRPLQAALEAAERSGPFGGEVTLGLMAEGARQFEALRDLDAFEDSNDIHVTAVVQCMAHWQARSPGPFEVVHDESIHFFDRSESYVGFSVTAWIKRRISSRPRLRFHRRMLHR
jgi:hypothetical protein